MRVHRRWATGMPAALLAAALFAGCGGGGSGSSAPPVSQVAAATQQRSPVQVTVVIPRAASAAARDPQYVSPSTQSMSISATASGSSPVTSTANCPPPATACSATVLAPVGTDAFTVNLYSQTNAAGSVLSTGTTSYTVVAGVTNNVAITLGGQIATLSVTLSQSTFAAGTPATATVAVTALDAGGNAIALPGNYASPVTLVDSDTSGATTLSTTSLAAPGATATLSYNGSNGLAGSTVAVTASASGATNGVGTLSIGPPSPSPRR